MTIMTYHWRIMHLTLFWPSIGLFLVSTLWPNYLFSYTTNLCFSRTKKEQRTKWCVEIKIIESYTSNKKRLCFCHTQWKLRVQRPHKKKRIWKRSWCDKKLLPESWFQTWHYRECQSERDPCPLSKNRTREKWISKLRRFHLFYT